MQVINILFLAGFLALSVPIIIHLLKNKKVKKVWLGSLRFLEAARKAQRRKRNLKERLLLLLRICAVLLLVFVFLRPYSGANQEYDKDDNATIILIDVSGSMSGKYKNKRMLNAAQNKAKELVGELEGKTNLTLAAFADDIVEIDNLEELQQTSGASTNYQKAIQWAQKRLLAAPKKHMDIIMISDMQRIGLQYDVEIDLPEFINFYIYPILPAGNSNQGILVAQIPEAIVGKTCKLYPELILSGDLPEKYEVNLLIDGEVVDGKISNIENGLKWKPETKGWHNAEIQLKTNDAWQFDNQFFFRIYAGALKSVLVVNGYNGQSRFTNASYYVEKAFNVNENEAYKSVNLSVKNKFNVSTEDLVVFCDFPGFSSKEETDFMEYIKNGGNAIFFIGDNSNTKQLNTLSQRGVFPAELEEIPNRTSRPILKWDEKHRALGLFKSRKYGNVSSIIFSEAFSLKPNEETTVLASLNNDNPAIVEIAHGKGKVIAIANSATRKYSDWPISRMFLPLVRELSIYLTGESEQNKTEDFKISSILNERILAGDSEIKPLTNFNSEESKIEFIGREAFLTTLGIHSPIDDVVELKKQKSSFSKKRQHENELFHWAGIGLLFFLLVEGFVSYLPK